MFSKKAIVALFLSASLLTACGRQPGFEMIDVSESDKAKKVEKKTEIVEQEFPIMTREDASLKPGEHQVVQKGVRGKSRVTYEITYQGGKEISRKALKEEVIQKPVAAIIKVGAKDSDGEDGKQQIIGYSDPKSDHSAQTPRIHNDEGDREVINKILSSSKEWDTEDDPSTSSQPSEKPSSGTSSEPSDDSSDSQESSSSTDEDSSSKSEESEDSKPNEDTAEPITSSDGEGEDTTEESKESGESGDSEEENGAEEGDFSTGGEDEDEGSAEEKGSSANGETGSGVEEE